MSAQVNDYTAPIVAAAWATLAVTGRWRAWFKRG
jgi:hypothetical protein